MSDPDDLVATVAAVLLVDARGWILLQLRDSAAPTAPDKWSMVGGHVEPGETPEHAARREVLEESAIAVDGPLTTVFEGVLPSSTGVGVTQWHVYAAPTAAGDADIVVGEGADIVFVPPADIAGLDLAPSAALVVPDFVGSARHEQLSALAGSA